MSYDSDDDIDDKLQPMTDDQREEGDQNGQEGDQNGQEEQEEEKDPELLSLLEKVTQKYKGIDKNNLDELDKVRPRGIVLSVKPVEIANLSKLDAPKEDDNGLIKMLEGVKNNKERRLLARNIKRKLDIGIKFRIPANIEIDEDVLKQVGQIPRSKVESGEDRATFILECRKWENENLKDDDKHYWTDKALDVLASWIGICEGDKTEMNQVFKLCKILFASKLIPSDPKLNIASAFYLAGYLEYCYDLYLEILECPYTRLLDRAECCKFLYHSNDPKYRGAIEKNITEIIETDGDDDSRYETIACFVTNTGVASRYLIRPLDIEEVDQTLISKLFLKFIKTNPDVFYVTMASEFLLEQTALGMPIACDDCKEDDMITFDEEGGMCDCDNPTKYGYPDVKQEVCQNLLDIALDKTKDERTRADVSDVLINHNIEPYASKARDIIHEIGTDGQTELEKTVYSNKENVHLLNDTFIKYIEEKHTKLVGSLQNIDEICEEIENMADDYDDEELFKIRKSIDRIMLETTLHTDRKISTADIFRLMWTIIKNHDKQEQLVRRFMEELIDMANTCSSGHSKRLVNVMVGFTDDLEGSISIKDQLVANIKARLNASIRHLPEEESSLILDAMIETGDAKLPFINHIMKVLPDIKKELSDEFVDEWWISEKKFNKVIDSTLDELLK